MKDEQRRLTFFILLITIFAGILRFSFLSRPPIWGDEARTYIRVCGSFQQLVDALVSTDFAPLHYLLCWSFGRFTTLTPTMLRLPAAIAGTLMVPAIFALSIQIVSRRTAVLVALFTACSAYMLNYSRDAKMYAEFWLFVTLSTACLLWWLRTHKRFAWYLWVICSLVMVGLHALGAIVLAIQLLIFLSSRRLHWKPAIFFFLGLSFILAPLIVYYARFNNFSHRVEENGRWASGVFWVEPYNQGRDGLDLVRFTSTAFLYNWEWPRPVDESQIGDDPRRLLKFAGIAMFVLFVMGIFPWRHSCADGSNPEPWWRVMFWISAWIILPVFGFYCASMASPMPPWRWIGVLGHLIIKHPWVSGAGLIAAMISAFVCAGTWKSRLLKAAIFIAVAAVLFGLCALAFMVVPRQPSSVWMPRYLGIIWPAFAIAACALLIRLPTRPIRIFAIGLVLTINLILSGARFFAASEPPTELMAHDVLASDAPASVMRSYFRLSNSPMGEPGAGMINSPAGRYYRAIFSGIPASPDELRLMTPQGNFLTRVLPLALVVPAEITNNASLNRVVVWDQLNPGSADTSDPLLHRLPPQWKRISEESFATRDHWTWRNLTIVRRHVYQKQPS